jgi:hypothetical protein
MDSERYGGAKRCFTRLWDGDAITRAIGKFGCRGSS